MIKPTEIFRYFVKLVLENTISALICFVVAFILFFSSANFVSVIYHANHEISYSGRIIVSECNPQFQNLIKKNPKDDWKSSCMTIYQIKVGNTGAFDQENIRIRMPRVSFLVPPDISVQNLIASNENKRTPEIQDSSQNDGIVVYDISPLPQNTLVTIKFTTVGMENARLLESMEIQVEAYGRIVESDPQATVLARFLHEMFGWLQIF